MIQFFHHCKPTVGLSPVCFSLLKCFQTVSFFTGMERRWATTVTREQSGLMDSTILQGRGNLKILEQVTKEINSLSSKNIIPFNKCIVCYRRHFWQPWWQVGWQAIFLGWQLPPLATPVVSPLLLHMTDEKASLFMCCTDQIKSKTHILKPLP